MGDKTPLLPQAKSTLKVGLLTFLRLLAAKNSFLESVYSFPGALDRTNHHIAGALNRTNRNVTHSLCCARSGFRGGTYIVATVPGLAGTVKTRVKVLSGIIKARAYVIDTISDTVTYFTNTVNDSRTHISNSYSGGGPTGGGNMVRAGFSY